MKELYTKILWEKVLIRSIFRNKNIKIVCIMTFLFSLVLISFLDYQGLVVADNPSLKIGIDRSYAPQEFYKDGLVQGFTVDILNTIIPNIGYQPEFHPMYWNDAMSALKNGSIDVICGFDTPERHVDYDFSTPILNITQSIFVRNDIIGVDTVQDLANHTVAVENNDVADTYLMEHVPDAHIVRFNTQEEAIQALADGDVFAFFGLYNAGLYYIQQNNLSGIKVIGESVNVGPYCFIVKKGNSELLSKINDSLSTIITNGQYQQFYEKWYGLSIDDTTGLTLKWIAIVILITFGIIGLLLFWNYMLKKRVEERTIELEKSKEYLIQQDKIDSIGLLAGGIAHDFNNILTSVMGGISLIKFGIEEETDNYQILEDTEKAITRAKDLTQQLLTFSKGGAPVKKLASISDIIKDSANFMAHGSNIKINFDFENDIPPVSIDPGQISQVINNLVLNSIQAMPDGGNIDIGLKKISKNKLDPLPLSEGKYLKLTVTDHGVGIPKELEQRIFTPFFSTKANGNGLGLTSAYSIIKKHNGFMVFESQENVGTTFFIYLPISSNEASKIIKNKHDLIYKTSGKILVMDDDKSVRLIAEKMLKRLGYKVDVVESGQEAIKMYMKKKDSGDFYDLVILDLTVPGGKGGRETLSEIKSIDPNVKAIVSSGYSSFGLMSDYNNHGFSAVLRKPYTLEELGTTIQNILKPEEPKKNSVQTNAQS